MVQNLILIFILVGFWGFGVNGAEVWISDGTSNGTYMLADINTTALGESSNIHFVAMTESGDTAYFVADDGVHGWELWAIA